MGATKSPSNFNNIIILSKRPKERLKSTQNFQQFRCTTDKDVSVASYHLQCMLQNFILFFSKQFVTTEPQNRFSKDMVKTVQIFCSKQYKCSVQKSTNILFETVQMFCSKEYKCSVRNSTNVLFETV